MAEHMFYKCPPDCDRYHCPYCEGGLAFCEVCLCAEGELPTECPGKPLMEDTREDIYDGKLDFKEGEFVSLEESSNG